MVEKAYSCSNGGSYQRSSNSSIIATVSTVSSKSSVLFVEVEPSGKNTLKIALWSRRPALPRRCLNEATVIGCSTCAIDATSEISIPNSKVAVQIAVVGHLPSCRRYSKLSLNSLDKEPWCGKNSFGTNFFLLKVSNLAARDSVVKRELQNTKLVLPRNSLKISLAISSNS